MRRGIFTAMRPLFAALVLSAACSAAPPPAASTPTANLGGAPSPTGTVIVRLGGDYPDLRFPLRVSYDGGSAVIPDGGEHRVAGVPASDDELTRIEVEGWRPIWVRVPVGGEVTLSAHPCCGVTFDSNTYDDAIATCAPAGDGCPIELTEVPHALAVDPVCGEQPRCVPRTKVRVVQTGSAEETGIVDADGEVYRAGEPEGLVLTSIADMFTFSTSDPEQRQDVAMDRGATYTIRLDGDIVTGVTVSRWPSTR